MKAHPERLTLARAVGTDGCDYCTSSDTVVFSDVIGSDVWTGVEAQGWYGFYVAEEATVATVTFRSRITKAALTPATTPTWKSVALPAGCWIPAGVYQKEAAYIDTFALTSGKVILYRD